MNRTGTCNWLLVIIYVCADINLLVVGSNVSLAASLILQDTILQSQCEGTGKLTLLEVTLGGLDDGLNLEGP